MDWPEGSDTKAPGGTTPLEPLNGGLGKFRPKQKNQIERRFLP